MTTSTPASTLISIPGFLRAEPFGRSKLYRMIDAGDVETVCVGRRRLIVLESYRAYVDRLKTEDVLHRPSPNPKAPNYARAGQPIRAAAAAEPLVDKRTREAAEAAYLRTRVRVP